jgi:uncharacterized membrane protein YiaA
LEFIPFHFLAKNKQKSQKQLIYKDLNQKPLVDSGGLFLSHLVMVLFSNQIDSSKNPAFKEAYRVIIFETHPCEIHSCLDMALTFIPAWNRQMIWYRSSMLRGRPAKLSA